MVDPIIFLVSMVKIISTTCKGCLLQINYELWYNPFQDIPGVHAMIQSLNRRKCETRHALL